MSRLLLSIRALMYASGFITLWWWLAIQVRPIDGRLAITVPPWAVPVGALLALLGILVGACCIVVFVRFGRGTPAPFDPPRDFVARGPYRYVRNPMYLGGLLVILGAGLVVRSPSIAALAVVFLLVMHLLVVLHEEPSLERRFSSTYSEYKLRVNRWLPTFCSRRARHG